MSGETVQICGVEVHVASQEECEQADAVVCMRKGAFSPFTDNLEAPCSGCGKTVIFRPYMPAAVPKLCLECAIGMTGPKQ